MAGGAITSTSNAAIDIVSGNVPQMKNFGDVVKYVGQEAAWGTATSLVGSQVGKVIGPQIAKLGKSVGGWFRNTFQAYAKESLQTVIINGEPVTTTIDVGIKATKQYVAKSLGSSAGSVAKGTSTGLTEYYPKNGGALTTWKREFLMPGMEIDRFGSGFGKYFSPRGTPLEMRALPSGNTGNYNAFRVVKPFEVQSSIISPAFGKTGLGTQYLSPVNMNVLLRRGIIVPIK